MDQKSQSRKFLRSTKSGDLSSSQTLLNPMFNFLENRVFLSLDFALFFRSISELAPISLKKLGVPQKSTATISFSFRQKIALPKGAGAE